MDAFGRIALVWMLLYFGARYASAVAVGRRATPIPPATPPLAVDVSAPAALPAPARGRRLTATIATVGLAAAAVWLTRKVLVNRG